MTDPFTSTFVSRLIDQTQAYRLRCRIGRIVSLRFYCCDDPPNLGITKAPAAVLDLDPDTTCVAVDLAWDVSGSYSPTGTIDVYSISWGDGTTTGPNPWAGAKTGNKQYANPGIYTVKLTVTDTLGVSGTVTYTVEIIDCATDSILIEVMYALSQTAGPYIRDMLAAIPAWVQRVRGLTGNWLNGRDLKLDPHRNHLGYGRRHVWIATQAGPAKSSTDTLFWSRLYAKLNDPRNSAGDFPAPVKANLDFVTVAFNPMVRDEIYILAYETVMAPTRSFVYFTLDGGKTWDNWEVRR